MPRTYFGPYGEQNSTYAGARAATITGADGRYEAGSKLVLPDEREYRFTLNDGTAEVAANLYQSALPVSNHRNIACDVARAVGATVISATLGATAAAVDVYAEGYVHVNDAAGEGYNHRIRRASSDGNAHAAVASSGVITVNLAAGETVQVALTTASEVTFSHNRFRVVLIHDSPPTASLVGISPGVAAANRWYWSQVSGEAAVLTQGTLVIGDFCVPSATVDGAVMPSAAFETDGPYVGIVRSVNADTEQSLIDLKIG